MPGAVSNQKKLYLGKCLEDLHKLSEIKPLSNSANLIVKSAAKVFVDAEKFDNERDEERALVMYMKYFNLLKQVKSKPDYKKQKEYFDNLIGRKNQYRAIERAEKLTESLKDRYDYQEAEALAKKLPSATEAPTAKKEIVKEAESPPNRNDVNTKPDTKDSNESSKSSSVNCMQLCELLRDSSTQLIIMDIRSNSDFAKSHISHSECVSVPEECIVPGSTVNHIEAKLTSESKAIWKTRKIADYIILVDWRSKIEDVKVGTRIQTLKDALYKFDTSVVIKSEPVFLEGGYEKWLQFYPTMTTNPHISVPQQSDDEDKAPSPTLMLDFDYPELDENLQKKSKAPEIPINNNVVKSMDSGNVPLNTTVPMIDRSLKPSKSNRPGGTPSTPEPASNNEAINNSQVPRLSDNAMYPALITPPKMTNGQSQIEANKADDMVTNQGGPKPINLSVKNNLSTTDSLNNGQLQEEKDKTEEVEEKLRQLEILKKKKERDVADLMRKERKIKEELETERLKREETERLQAVDNEHKKIENEKAMKDEEEKKRLLGVERMRADRKKQEEERLMQRQKEAEELERINTEQESLRIKKEQERKERELKDLEEQKRIEEEEEQNIIQEMKELEKAKAERAKKQELKRLEQEKQLEAQREKENREKEILKLEALKKEEEEKKKKEQINMEAARKAKEDAEKKRMLETSNKENDARESRSDKNIVTNNLPTGWEKRLDKDTNRYYYIDHNRGVTTWSLPPGVGKDITTTRLKDETSKPSLSRGMSRSHSSPNIMKELADEEEALSKKPVFSVDRGSKPLSNTNNRLSKPTYSIRKRDLNPTYGNVIQGLTGLRNLGNTCYMNSTIQCLNNTSPLITYFLSDNYQQDINRESTQGMHGEVVDDFSIVIKALWSGQYRSITPRDLKSTVGKYNPMFAGYQQQDSQEFLTFLLDGLHEGLNEVKKGPDIPEQNNDRLSDDKAAKIAWEHHKLLHRSIVVELFQGQLKSKLMCRTCGKTSVTFQAFMFLSLPIPASSRCSLKDCMQEFLKPEMMTGSCKWKCPSCKVERDSEKKIDIWKLPPILLVGLNRFYSDGMWMQKKTTYVDFPIMDVDFSPFILGPSPRARYNLYGISNHYGTMEGGHYTAFCRNPVTTKWHKFDDQDVSEISKSDIKTSAAFVLYYTSIEMAAPKYRI